MELLASVRFIVPDTIGTTPSDGNKQHNLCFGCSVHVADFETFFGGSTSAWATPTTQYSYFKGFSLSYQ
jgi:hypothetical protein